MLMDLAPLLSYFPRFSESKTVTLHHYQLVYNCLSDVIAEHEGAYYLGKQDNFIDAFIGRMGAQYRREHLIFIVRDLFMAGTETTATTLQWILMYMANNQDVQVSFVTLYNHCLGMVVHALVTPHCMVYVVCNQRRVQEELDGNIGRGRPVTLDDKSRLPYVEAVIQESQSPPALLGAVPHRTLADTELCGYHIPEKATVCFRNFSSIPTSVAMYILTE